MGAGGCASAYPALSRVPEPLRTVIALIFVVHFGDRTSMFTGIGEAVWTLLQVSVGALPELGSHPLLSTLVAGFFVMGFFLMLNFTIAIVVDSYTKAKEEVEADDSELGFFTDVLYSLLSESRRIALGAPPPRRTIKLFNQLHNQHLSAALAAQAFEPATPDLDPTQRTRMALRYLTHFRRYEALQPGYKAHAKTADWEQEKLLNKLSCMLNQPVPTNFQALVARHRLQSQSNKQAASTALSEQGSSAALFNEQGASQSLNAAIDASAVQVSATPCTQAGTAPRRRRRVIKPPPPTETETPGLDVDWRV